MPSGFGDLTDQAHHLVSTGDLAGAQRLLADALNALPEVVRAELVSRQAREADAQLQVARQELQRLERTAAERRVSGNSPCSIHFTQVRNEPSGTSFSALHATVQAWQPMHASWSSTKP